LAAWCPVPADEPVRPVGVEATPRQGSRTPKYPILTDGDEAGFAELTPEQQE
jgi:hypothetical protein